jgi:hypothetical protein
MEAVIMVLRFRQKTIRYGEPSVFLSNTAFETRTQRDHRVSAID